MPGAPKTSYALLIRGINVGAKNSLPMAELRKMLERIGCEGVQTYVQSGNAVFCTPLSPDAATEKLEAAIARYMGRKVDVTLRTEKQMKAIIKANPFVDIADNPSNLCVTFLSHPVTKAQVAPLFATDFGPEKFKAARTELYTWHPHGQGQSPLREALWKLPLEGAVTTRNWNTVLKVAELMRKI